jgi:hypothetical protein
MTTFVGKVSKGAKLMANQTEIEKYNYRDFVSSDFLPFRTHLPVGSSAPDYAASLLDTGQPVRLSGYWKKNHVVIEFGSLT